MATRDGEFWTTSRPADADDPVGEWQEMLSATHLLWTVRIAPPEDDRPFEAWVRRWRIDDLALVDCECSPCSGRGSAVSWRTPTASSLSCSSTDRGARR